MRNITRRALRVYAAIGELRGENGDAIDALLPFFEPILLVMNGKFYDPGLVTLAIKKMYGWHFTRDIAEQIAPHLEKRGILQRAIDTKQGRSWVVKFAGPSQEESKSTPDKSISEVIDEIHQFAPTVTGLVNYQKSKDELTDILVRFLVSMDTSGDGIYNPGLEGLTLSADVMTLLDGLEEGGRPLDPSDRYICARFVHYIMERKKHLAPALVRLASIGLLTEVVDDFLKPTDLAPDTNLTLLLDAPLALDYLGCSGRTLRDDIRTVVDSLKSIGVKFAVIPVTCQEMQHNLSAMLSEDPSNRFGYTHSAIIKREVGIDYVRAVANDPERALLEEGIPVKQVSLDSFPNQHKHFTSERYEDLLASFDWGSNIQAREHDAICATLAIRLREGHHYSDIFRCSYALVTRNSSFVRRVRSYCLESRIITPLQQGPVILHKELAMTAWLRTGLNADQTVPMRHLVAICERILLARPEVKKALEHQLSNITPERLAQMRVLMQDSRSVQKLSDETLNNENVITAENADVLLSAMREATATELIARHEEQLRNEKEERRRHVEELERNAEALRAAADAQKSISDRLIADAARRAFLIVNQANSIAWKIEAAVCVFVIVVSFVVYLIVSSPNFWVNAFISICAFAASVFSAYRLVCAVLERRTRGLASLLNSFLQWWVHRQLRIHGIDLALTGQQISFASGRVQIVSPFALDGLK